MLWSWIPYRKATHQGRRYVSGECELQSLQEVIEASINSIERVTLNPDESLVALRKWREMVALAKSGEITEAQLAEWITYQDVSLPPALDAGA
jgi:hypothetical protein